MSPEMSDEAHGMPAACFPAMHVVDLTRTVGPGMSCYPGTPLPESLPLCSIWRDGFDERMLSFSSHTGTHVDLPLHLIPQGNSLDSFSADRFIGPAAVLDVSDPSVSLITEGMLRPHSALLERSEFVLIRSGWGRYWGTAAYLSGYPVLGVEAAAWLAGFGLKGVGIDMISADPANSQTFPVHRVFLEKNIVIIENLFIPEELSGRQVMFFSLPLKLDGAEASPVRAVALVR